MVTWTDRDGFIEMAAKAVLCGDPLEMVFEELPKYAESYKRGQRPVLGPKQKSHVMHAINKRVRQMKCNCDCGPV